MFLFGQKASFANICNTIVNYAEDGVVVINDAHEIILFNKSAEKIFGYDVGEVMHQPLDILLPESMQMQHGAHIDRFAAEKKVSRGMADRTRQIFGRRKDGEEFIASVSIVRIEDGGKNFFAAMVRDVSQSKQTEEELLRLAATDPLTGIYNRREFTAMAEREAQRANRYGRALSVLMLDLDHFKRLNDTYGHATGDKALQRFATLCSNTLRNVDIFARWGGEEFVALLPETDIEGAAVIGERLRKTTADSALTVNDHKIHFTVSVGIAQFRSGEMSLDVPLNRADSAVYDAKKAGRNRISVYRNT